MRAHTRATVGLVQVEPTVVMRKETPARPQREELVMTRDEQGYITAHTPALP